MQLMDRPMTRRPARPLWTGLRPAGRPAGPREGRHADQPPDGAVARPPGRPSTMSWPRAATTATGFEPVTS